MSTRYIFTGNETDKSMWQSVKQLLKKTPLYVIWRALYNLRAKMIQRRLDRREIAEWERQGRPVPPPHLIKQRVLRQYAREHGLRVLVETGTYLGEMVDAMKDHFDTIYSIELSDELHRNAAARFASHPHIRLLHGDSAVMLKRVVAELDEPALFWLDGHFSGGVTARGEKDTPVFEELTHVLEAPDLGHVVIIDDARHFGVDPAYPGIAELEDFVNARRKRNISVKDDSIRIVPLK